jgi:uncharacterized secreted protein with C-terminal beta-propeller domain
MAVSDSLPAMPGRVIATTGVLAALVATAVAAPAGAAAGKLRRFDSCPTLVSYASAHASAVPIATRPGTRPAPTSASPTTTTDGAVAPAATTAPTEVSATNVQEAGVDEPDTVKVDGGRLLAISGGVLYAVDPTADRPRVLGSVALPPGSGHQLLVHDGRALVIASGPQRFVDGPIGLPQPVGGPTAATTPTAAPRQASGVGPGIAILPYGPPTTILAEVDVHDPAAMAVVRTMTFDGSPVDSRLTGATARVVVSSPPRYAVQPLLRTAVSGWVPTATLSGRGLATPRKSRLVPCTHVRRPPAFSGTGLLTVLTVDVDRGLPAIDADALMTDGDTVYAAPGSLYVATRRWEPPTAVDADQIGTQTTAIHRFDTTADDTTTYAASGSVPGTLLSQFALSQERGVLRVASTGDRESMVTTLRERDGALARLGQVGGLGPDERIRAVRFIGDVGYVVTFKQTDPLYTVDLTDPSSPRVVGELPLLGYSAYLHPIGDGRLLGVGQDATDQGRVLGTQLSLFDVSDPARPTRLAARSLGLGSWSAAESDHHAFLWWPKTRLAVIPVTQSAFSGAIGLHVSAGAIDEAGRAPGSISRSTVIGDRLFLLAVDAIHVAALTDLADRGTIPLTAPTAP